MAKYQTPRGTRDFLPAEMHKRQFIISAIRETYELFGFQPLETPAFESWELLCAKGGGGEAVKNEIYYFKDKSDRELGLRFDLTVPLARVIANNPQLAKPFKRYQIQPVWRYDNPQAGRYREFCQADVDIAGTSGMQAEAELIAVAASVLEKLGIKKYSIKLNNRKILNGMIQLLGIKEPAPVFRVLDKIEKVSAQQTSSDLQKLMQGPAVKKLMSFIGLKGSAKTVLAQAGRLLGQSPAAIEGIAELTKVIGLLPSYGLKANVQLDFSLVRGLDYYTGPIFEISVDSEKSPGSVCGGGRYDNLVGLYGGQPTSCAGFSFGVDRLCNLLEAEGLFSKLPATSTQVFVINVNDSVRPKAIELAGSLRQAGIRVETDIMGRNLRKQLDYINSAQIPYALFVGERELKEKKFTLREMKTGKEQKLAIQNIVKKLSC